MNKFYYILALLLGVFASCSDDNEYQLSFPSVEDTMKMAISAETVTVSKTNLDETAVTFTWHPAAQRQEGAEISYGFKFWISSNGPKSVKKIELQPSATEYALTHRQLVDYLKACGIVAGETVEMTAEVIADIHSTRYMKPEISRVDFKVITVK